MHMVAEYILNKCTMMSSFKRKLRTGRQDYILVYIQCKITECAFRVNKWPDINYQLDSCARTQCALT